MTKRLFINDDGSSAYVAIVAKDAPPVPSTAEHNGGKSNRLYVRQRDMVLPSGTLIEVYVEQAAPAAREVAEAAYDFIYGPGGSASAWTDSPALGDLAKRWHEGGRP